MDFIKKAAASFSNKDKKPAEGQQQDGKKDDYVDKGMSLSPRCPCVEDYVDVNRI